MTFNWFAILVDNKFGEIPLDAIEQETALFFLQILPQWMSTLAVDINLLEQVKLDLTVTDKALNFFGVAWLLVIELITGKGENAKS